MGKLCFVQAVKCGTPVLTHVVVTYLMTLNSKLVHALCEEIERPSYVTWTLFLFFLIWRAKPVGIQREAVHGATAPNGAKVAALRSLFACQAVQR